MDIAPTADNRALAAAVNARIRSESRIINAKAALWRLGGVGLLCMLIGMGIGAAFYGYSYVGTDRAPRTDQVAQALTQALEKTTLKVEPATKPEPAAAAAATPMAKPTETQLGTDAAPPSRANVATAFTVFKNVPFGTGQVVTGWNFASGDQASPNHQYCYYSEQIDGTSKVTIDLGENGRTLPATKTRTSVDPVRAYANCVWFKSGTL